MRYLGNKTKLLDFIENVIAKHGISGKTFVDLFSGTCSVGDHFKDRFTVIANDYMYFAKVLAAAKLLNAKKPDFELFVHKFNCTPFEYLNDQQYEPQENYFIYNNYSPVGERMYFTEENAIRIDGMRLEIEALYKDAILSEPEYYYLLGSLMESVLRVANTSGTFQAFFKFWEQRSQKRIVIEPLFMKETDMVSDQNKVTCEDANVLCRRISGDIVYIDPPYTITQYASSYHVLETIARYDNPDLFGKTGRRKKRVLSNYSNKSRSKYEFEDLFRQLDFEHVLVSYSNQSLVSLEELVELARLFAIDGNVEVETLQYREYTTNNLSYKDDGSGLKETIIYFRKDRSLNKSPLNYAGSKDGILPRLTKLLPKHVPTFVDAMGGAFNVGANIVATKEVIYYEPNPYIFNIMKMIVDYDPRKLIEDVDNIVNEYGLEKKAKEPYLALRNDYNNGLQPVLQLFVLQIYSFQHIIRFNASKEMNTPIGNNEFNKGTRQRIIDFRVKTHSYRMLNERYQSIDYQDYPEDTIFYFDPPYFITTAEYNDGKRGFDGWNVESETQLLDFLLRLHRADRKFILSNVISHKGRRHNILESWAEEHEFIVTTIGSTGIKYPRVEVIVTNYMPITEITGNPYSR
ncbi:modification methylase [Atopobium sp. HMSC064B08]|nr:modification methylase [Atopobium sp. HMSC064B08]